METVNVELKAGAHSGEIRGLDPMNTQQSARDTATLARLGKKPVLKRNFGFITILGFSCTLLITWEGSLLTFLSGLQNGGPSGIIYGFLIVWAGTTSVFATLGELASMAPTSGGQYHWVSMLAPPASRKFLGYMTGWLTITGWQSLLASGGYVTGTMIQGLILLTHPDYANVMQNWHGTLLFWAVILLSLAINTAISSLLARFEGLGLVIHILGFFGVILPLVLLGEHTTADQVFDNFSNLGGWQTEGLSFCVGLSGVVFAFLGGDGAIHMSEEIRNADLVVPRSLMMTIVINGTLGFAMMIATLFCIGDVDEAMAENPGYPFMAILNNAVGSTAGAAVMSAVVVVMSFSATAGCLAATSRLYWAFARDRALPGWSLLKKTSPRTSIPLPAVLVAAIVAIILSLVNIGSSTAFNGVISISIAGLFSSYLIAASLLLYRRLNGDIVRFTPDHANSSSADVGLMWGRWRLPRLLGLANNTFSCCYLTFVLFFSFWPSSLGPSAATMNWAVLVFGVVVCFSMLYYLVWARKVYSGPIVEV